MIIPYLHRPHDSGPIQWARGDVGQSPQPPRTPCCDVHAHLPRNLCSRAYNARSGISRSGATFCRHHGAWFHQDMEQRCFFLEKSSSQNPPVGPKGEPLARETQRATRWSQKVFNPSFSTVTNIQNLVPRILFSRI